MTIRLLGTTKNLAVDEEFGHVGEYVVRSQYGEGPRLASADTREEAEQAKRAFENVLAPRFTRDEAIAIVKEAISKHANGEGFKAGFMSAGARLALEALAAAGVFSDSPCTESNDANRGVHPALRAQFAEQMSDKLDAAGIR